MPVRSRPTLARLCTTTLFAALALGVTGCADEDQSGTLTVEYQFGAADRSCAEEGVTDVRISLSGTEFAHESCDDEPITLPSVPAKGYSVLVEGIDAEGTTIRDNLGSPATDENVEVLGGSSQTIEVRMTPTPATLRMRFIVLDDDGAPYPPAATVPIKSFDVVAYRNGGSLDLLSHSFVYAQLMSTTVDVPDPDRDLVGDDLDYVTLDVIDQQNAQAAQLSWDIDPPPGAGRIVEIVVTCHGTDCSGELEVIGGGSIDPTAGTGTGGAETGGTG